VRVRFHPEAEAEVLTATEWYESERPGLGTEFLESLERAGGAIRERPETWPRWPGVQERLGIHRYLMERFPFGIAYEIDEDGILVLAVAHLKRRERYWAHRV
jgi:hypothetical protein